LKKYTLIFVCSLLSLFAVLIGSCQGSTGLEADSYSQLARDVATLSPTTFGPNANPPPRPPLDPNEFAASAQHVTVEQVKNYANETPVIVTGNLVQAIGGDSFIFRDSSGTINMRIGPREWEIYGSRISMSDFIEISGELHRDQGGNLRPAGSVEVPGDRQRSPEIHIHARYIGKLL
jgi:uncharacterized protein (TIGR00156 family)